MKTKWIAIIAMGILVTFSGVSMGDDAYDRMYPYRNQSSQPSYQDTNTYKTNQAYPGKQQALEDQIYSMIYSHARSRRPVNDSISCYLIRQALPYQNTRQLRNEIKSVAYQGMTGSYDWDSHKDTIIQRYKSRGADLGPTLMNRFHDRGKNPNIDLGFDIAQDAWNTQVMPRIFNIK